MTADTLIYQIRHSNIPDETADEMEAAVRSYEERITALERQLKRRSRPKKQEAS